MTAPFSTNSHEMANKKANGVLVGFPTALKLPAHAGEPVLDEPHTLSA